jgi:ribulose-phosphate 3-epimerase
MIEIIPAIMPQNVGEIRTKSSMVFTLVKTIQIDFCDGVYVATKSWPFNGKDVMAYNEIVNEETGLPYWEQVNYEFDLMAKNASEQFDRLLKIGPNRLVFHLEAEDNLLGFFETVDPYYKDFIEMGVAINTTTDTDLLIPLLPHIKFVQCMGIAAIGKQRQPFDERVIGQILKVRALAPNMIISVDGAVNKTTAHPLLAAGANRLVIGSALFDEVDIQSTVEDFQNLKTDL